MEGVEQTKVKEIHGRDTLRNPLEHQLKYITKVRNIKQV
jgi:hypothetical protein